MENNLIDKLLEEPLGVAVLAAVVGLYLIGKYDEAEERRRLAPIETPIEDGERELFEALKRRYLAQRAIESGAGDLNARLERLEATLTGLLDEIRQLESEAINHE